MTSFSSIRATALTGINRGLSEVAAAAESVSTSFAPNGDGDIADDAVRLSQGEQTVRANQRVFGVVKRLEDAVLDILA